MLSSILMIVLFLVAVSSANDWNTPCVNGQCSYDLPATTGSSGTLKIWGSENAITDITPAADWQILDCNQTAGSQNIRLVCINDDPSSLCAHLYQNAGAVNKIVRLPENCSSNAFARVAKSWVSDDQSIPSSIKARLVRRDGARPEVKALAIDTNFDAVDSSKTGKVNFAIGAVNVPGAATDIQIPGSRRASRSRRGLISNRFTESKTFSIKPVTFNKTANLFNTSVSCGPTSASLSVDINANATAQPSITISAEGSILPPKFTKFEAVAGMTAQVFGGLTVSAELSGHVDSGPITLLNVGIPGLDFGDILTIGPSFQIAAQFVGDVDIAMDLSVGLNFDVNNAQLTFPPNSNATDPNAFSIGDTPLSLSATPSVEATGTLTAHLIPSLNLGLTAFGGKGNAEVSVAVDTSAALVLNLDASAQITQPIGTNSTESSSETNNGTLTSIVSDSTQSIPTTTLAPVLSDSDATDSAPTLTTTPPTANASATTDASSAVETDTGIVKFATRDDPTVSESFGGCVEVDGGINVTAGIQGKFFDLFDKQASFSLFNKNFQIFKKCFGDGDSASPAPTKRWMRRHMSALGRQRRSPFSCPSPGLSAPQSVADETVSSSSVTDD